MCNFLKPSYEIYDDDDDDFHLEIIHISDIRGFELLLTNSIFYISNKKQPSGKGKIVH